MRSGRRLRGLDCRVIRIGALHVHLPASRRECITIMRRRGALSAYASLAPEQTLLSVTISEFACEADLYLVNPYNRVLHLAKMKAFVSIVLPDRCLRVFVAAHGRCRARTHSQSR